MGYLLPAEYELYGLRADTADALVRMASALMEAHCRRPTLMAAQYTERMRMRTGAQTLRLSYGPLMEDAIQSARVRYAQGRGSEWGDAGTEIATAFGLPGSWTDLDPATAEVSAGTREVQFPRSFLGIGYGEAEVTYTAGFVTVPEQIKVACAQIAKNAEATPALNVKNSRLDTMQMTYFGDSLLDVGVREMLRPYRAERLG